MTYYLKYDFWVTNLMLVLLGIFVVATYLSSSIQEEVASIIVSQRLSY